MTLEEFARHILFGTSLAEKLKETELESEFTAPTTRLLEIPAFPPRPAALSKPGKARFPDLNRLGEPLVRGEVLHFFANHELLAMELMALMLLRFPEAPAPYRLGLAHTIQEEQSHLRLYLERMRELGVEFGDLPVSDYFWKAMSHVSSPMEFVIQMNLSFEQANLDFSLFFMKAVAATGDTKTAAILERVYREEIGHVKFGVTWFNRWRGAESAESAECVETDWDAYVRLLPPPMTARRAKGFGYTVEARREAGLSETFIRELRLHSGSKGRPPVVWHYNPHCDAEIARGNPGFTPTAGAQRLGLDLEALPMFLASNQDVVLVKERPGTAWLEDVSAAGFPIPEFATSVRAPKLSGIEPWGWSPDSFDLAMRLGSRLAESSGANHQWCRQILAHRSFDKTGIGKLYSKTWSVEFLREWLGKNPESQVLFGGPETIGTCHDSWQSAKQHVSELLAAGHFAMVKAPYGTSGMQVRQIRSAAELEGPLGGWMLNTLNTQYRLVVEQWLDKACDLSIQMTVDAERTQLLEARRFVTGSRNEYRGTYLGKKLPGFEPEQLRFLHSVFPEWHRLLRDLGTRLRSEGFHGPAGVDALLWRDNEGALKLKPLVELNPRWTMGRVALELEQQLVPGTSGLWAFLPVRELQARGYSSAEAFARELTRRSPLELVTAGDSVRIASGALCTNDPGAAREVLTILATLPNTELESFLTC